MPSNHFNRRNRIVTVLLALASLLFMQLAIAGYSCEGSLHQVDSAAVVMPMAQTDMPCDEAMNMDSDHSSLCHAHCKADPQTADKYQLPAVPSLADLASDFPPPTVTPPSVGALLQAPLLRRITAPPLAVRNCCFRI
jgi:hypothetical protein